MSQLIELLFLFVFFIIYSYNTLNANELQEKSGLKTKKYESVAKIQQFKNEKRTFVGFCDLVLGTRPCVLTFSVSIKSHKSIISFLQDLVKHL